MKHVNTSPAYIQAPITREYVENFYNLVTGDTWTSLVADTGSTLTKIVGGGALLTSDGTDNDEVGLWTTDFIVPGTTSSVSFEITGRVKINTSLAVNAFIGLSSAFAADAIADDKTAAPIAAAGYYNGLFFLTGGSCYYSAISNGAETASQLLEFAPTAGSWFSYRLNYQYNSVDASIYCTPEIDTAGGQNFKPVRSSGNTSPVHPAFYQSPNVYASFPAAGLKFGHYFKATGAAATMNLDYAAWAIRRFN